MLLMAGAALYNIPANAQDVVYVTTYTPNPGSALAGCPPVCYTSGTVSTFGSTDLSAAPGAPSRAKCTYFHAGAPSFTIQPTLAVPGAIYKVETAHNSTASVPSCSADIVFTATTSDGTFSPEAVNNPSFQRAKGGPVWNLIGYITNVTAQPLITFTYVSGTVNNTGTGRIYIDAFKFTEINPCSGVAGDVGVTGPLAANQTSVTVTGVDAAASSVTVYADDVQIGQLTSGIVAGANTVPTSALQFGSTIKARQTKNTCTSPMPSSGPIVGGGANTTIRAFLSIGKNANLVGPIGAHTTNSFASTYTLKGDSLIAGSQSAPNGGHTLFPGQCWETVTFDHATDSALNPNNGIAETAFDPFGALDGLVFAIDTASLDSGPYDIYIDRIMNGDVVVEDFESYTVGGAGLLRAPNAASQPNAALAYLGAPNSSVISTNNSFDGTKSCRIRWQWANNNPVRWSRILANATAGKHYPQIDTTKPITIRYLVLPVGQTQDFTSYPIVPATQTKSIGQSVTFSASGEGNGPFTYQWKFQGADITDATTSSYTKSNLVVEDSGTYSVMVTGSSCTSTLNAGLTVSAVVTPPTLSYSVSGGQITLTWSGSFTLQSKTAITGTWADVTPTSGHQEALNSSTTKFFRLRQ